MTSMQSTGAQTAPQRDPLALFKLIEEQAKALKTHDHPRATAIEAQMRREFSGLLCLECSCEGYVHTPDKCTGLHGNVVCDCKGLKLDVTNTAIGGVSAAELFYGEDPFAGNVLFEGADIISICTRADLIADGDLIDVTKQAKELGILHPVALSKAVWGECVAWSDRDVIRRGADQDEETRLWNVLRELAMALRIAKANKSTSDTARFGVSVVPREGDDAEIKQVELKAIVHPGDAGERVITVMEPSES